MSTWESSQQADYDVASTKVFGGTKTGTPTGTLTLYRGGASQGVTAAYKYIPVAAGQLLVTAISDTGFSYQSGDEWRTDASNLFTITNWDFAQPYLKIEGSWSNPDTANFSISGWTTTNNAPLTITNSGAKHDGKRFGSPSTAYRRVVTNATSISFVEEHIRIYGIQFENVNTNGTTYFGMSAGGAAGATQIIGDCIAKGRYHDNGTNALMRGYSCNDGDVTMTVYNCLSYGWRGAGGSGFWRGSGNVYLYNSTAVDCVNGFTGSMLATNCIAQDCTDGFSSVGANSDYNCSDIASDSPGSNSVNNYEVPFVSETTDAEDFHLSSSATSVIGAGFDNASAYTWDVDNQTRSDWDMGWDEYFSAGGTSVVPWLYGRLIFHTGQ
jgi:hypothetical protein